MTSCASLEALEHLAGGEMSGSDAAHVQAHLESCSRCAAQYEECRVNRVMASELRAIHRRRSAIGSLRDIGRWRGELRHKPSIPGYRLDNEIRRGAQGAVYEAYHERMERRVAIKVILGGQFASEAARYRFEREVKLAANLKHPNIVPIHDSDISAGVCFFVMDYIDGQRLNEFVSAESPAIESRLRLFAKIAAAVHYAHQRGVIHRDLKPSNILVDSEGEPHILDFGLAKQVDEFEGDSVCDSLTLPGSVFGSLPYMSPEHTLGQPIEVDVRSDVYSLGVILYQMLTASFPYGVTGSVVDVFANITGTDPIPPSSISAAIDNEVETIVLKTLAKEKDRRYQSAGALAADIDRYLSGEAIEAKSDSSWYVLKKTLRRYRVPVGIAAVLVIVLTAALITSVSFWGVAVERGQEAHWQSYLANIAAADRALTDYDVVDARNRLNKIPEDQHDWVWRTLYSQLDQSLTVLRGHEHSVTAVAFSPDGRLIASGSLDATARIWDVASLKSVLTFEVGSAVTAIAFDPTGTTVLTGDGDSEVGEWSITTGELLGVFTTPGGNAIERMAVSPDGGLVLAGLVSGHLRAWSRDDRRVLWDVEAHAWNAHGLAFTNDGTRFISAGAGSSSTLAMRDARTGVLNGIFDTHQTGVEHLALSPDGHTIATAGKDGSIRLSDADSGTLRHSVPGSRGAMSCAAYSSDGELLVFGSRDHTVRIRDAATLEEVATWRGHEGRVNSIAVHPSGALVASGSADGSIRLWRALPHRPLSAWQGHARFINALAFAPDSLTVATASADMTVRFWTVPDGDQLTKPLRCAEEITSLAYASDGRFLAGGDQAGQIHIWNAGTGEQLAAICAHERAVLSLAFSPDASRLASGSGDDAIKVWNPVTGDLLVTLARPPGGTRDVAFSPDGRRLVSGGVGGSVRVWETTTGDELLAIPAHTKPVRAVAFSPSLTAPILASGSADGKAKLWDAETGTELRTLEGHSDEVRSIAFSPCGRYLASGSHDAFVKIWDVQSGDEILELSRHEDEVTDVAFSLDGRYLASTSRDRTVRLWGPLATGTIEDALAAHFARTEAHSLVDGRLDELTNPDPVLDALRTDAELSDLVRAAVLRLANQRAMQFRRQAFDLEEAAWNLVKSPEHTLEEYDAALEQARQAFALIHDNRVFRKTLGLALYRVGRYAEALEALLEADATCERPCETYPSHLAPLAMAQFRTGRAADAQYTLDRVEALMNRRHHWGDAPLASLFNEGAALIRGSLPTP